MGPDLVFEKKSGRKASAGPLAVTVTGPFSANNSEALRDAALDDMGIALLPDFTAQAAVRAGSLSCSCRIGGP